MSRQEFHFQEGNSSKFWAIDVQGPRFTVQFGRIGTAGQEQAKEFASDAEAQNAADKLIAEKTRKGYVAVGGAATARAPAAPAVGKKKPKPAPEPEMSKTPSSSAARSHAASSWSRATGCGRRGGRDNLSPSRSNSRGHLTWTKRSPAFSTQ